MLSNVITKSGYTNQQQLYPNDSFLLSLCYASGWMYINVEFSRNNLALRSQDINKGEKIFKPVKMNKRMFKLTIKGKNS